MEGERGEERVPGLVPGVVPAVYRRKPIIGKSDGGDCESGQSINYTHLMKRCISGHRRPTNHPIF